MVSLQYLYNTSIAMLFPLLNVMQHTVHPGEVETEHHKKNKVKNTIVHKQTNKHKTL